MWSPNDAERIHRNQGWQLGRVQRKMQRKEKSSELTLERIREAYEKVARCEVDVWVLCREF